MLTHDPGMYPKRLILDDARQFGIAVLGLDVNASGRHYLVERVDEPATLEPRDPARAGRGQGISDAEVARIVGPRGGPFHSLSDFWHRARVSRPVVERLVLAGGFDRLYGIGAPAGARRRGRVTRRDLLLQVAELDRYARTLDRHRPRPRPGGATAGARRPRPGAGRRRGLAQQHRPGEPRGGPGDRAARPGRRRGVGPRQRPVAGDPAARRRSTRCS